MGRNMPKPANLSNLYFQSNINSWLFVLRNCSELYVTTNVTFLQTNNDYKGIMIEKQSDQC